MPPPFCFTVKSGGLSSVLRTQIKVAEAFAPNGPRKPFQDFRAVWDTGASGTVITASVINGLGLKPIGITRTITANGPRLSPVYLVNVILPNNVSFSSMRVTSGDCGPDLDVLVGMDIIGTGDFVVTNFGGKTTFSFRVPSMEEIDFLSKADPTK